MAFAPQFLDDIRSRVTLSDVIARRIRLIRRGREHTGLCPFHNEKTPSFNVNAEKQYYYCFGCNATGTALTFLMQHDRLDFIAAVETLAARVGIEVPREQGAASKTTNDKPLYDVLAWADKWFQQALRTHPESERVKTYLKGRGVTGVTARDFGIGFAPPGWDTLVNALAAYEARAKQPSLREFLDEMALVGQEEQEKEDQGARVALMTLHSAKGLEFPHVYMVGMEEGLLPHRRSIEDLGGAAIDEERRLCYVGITRAKDDLTLSFCKARTKWGVERPQVPSRFLMEMRGQTEQAARAAAAADVARSA